jgi:DNA helicase II / ATP-dependent DNA helicase PcrA
MDFTEGLNPQQREAVAHLEGPLLILAGAGSGKTRVITHRIAHLIRSHGIPASAVLAVTFTNKAADEMRERVAGLLGEPPRRDAPAISTFHSFCVRLLRRDGAALADLRSGFTREFTIYDDDDQLALVRSLYRRLDLDEKAIPYRTALSRISGAKSQKETPQDLYKAATDPKSTRLALIYEEYDNSLRAANALDFDDLLLEAVRLLQHDSRTRRSYGERFVQQMIDEYQDTNRSQYELIRLLTEVHSNLCVVGDEDQSIYGWRGADIRNILDFEKDYPNAKIIRLEENYRSTQNVLAGAGAVVAHNTARKGKTLWTRAAEGDKIGLFEAPDAESEALFIAETIEQILVANPQDRVAVLYRTNAQSRQLEEALRRQGRKYIVVGGFSFYQRAEIKDVLGYLKLVASPRDNINLLRVVNTPARGVGKTTVEQLERYSCEQHLSLWEGLERMLNEKLLGARAGAALEGFHALIATLREEATRLTVDELLRRIVEASGYQAMLKEDRTPGAESRLENLDELINAAAEAVERGESVTEFLDHTALVSDSDAVDESSQVSLLTLHNAKGLEFPVVFIAGCEERLFPHGRSYDDAAMMEEERRLCYVGMTRARRRLILTWARARRRFGSGEAEACLRSRFISEIPADLMTPLGRRGWGTPVDLFSERHEVREAVKKNLYTGKTYNSLENIAQFFEERGGVAPAPPPVAVVVAKPAPAKKPAARGMRPGATIRHPRYGVGTVLRREGEGDDAKLTVNFPSYGLKKLVAKYAGLKIEE